MTALQKLYDLIDDIEIAMMTTRRADGHLQSRAMATQKPARGADLWFVTAAHSNKLREIDPTRTSTCRLSRMRTEWVSVSGVTATSTDRAKIGELYAAGLGDVVSERRRRSASWHSGRSAHGAVGVTVHAAEFLSVDKPRPVLLFELAKGWLTGTEPELGQMHTLDQPRRPLG